MIELDNGVSELDARLVEVLDSHLRDVEAGCAQPRAELLARHPDLAEHLETCLASLDFLRRESAAQAQGDHDPLSLTGYRIVRELGRGGMGIVYEAEQLSSGHFVALKILPFAAALDPRQLQRFKNEAEAAALLQHSNIVPVLGIGHERDVHYYVMKYVAGHSLAEIIQTLRGLRACRRDVLPTCPPEFFQRFTAGDGYWSEVARLGIQAALALEHAHQAGILHRDIKPANLLLDAAGHLSIADFGLARFQNEAGNLTQTGDLVGTLRYMSPEQLQGKRGLVDRRSDIYSLGMTLYELAALEPA